MQTQSELYRKQMMPTAGEYYTSLQAVLDKLFTLLVLILHEPILDGVAMNGFYPCIREMEAGTYYQFCFNFSLPNTYSSFSAAKYP